MCTSWWRGRKEEARRKGRGDQVLDADLILVRQYHEETEEWFEIAHTPLFQELLADHDNLLDRSHADLLAVVDQHPGDLRPEHTAQKGKEPPLVASELDDGVVVRTRDRPAGRWAPSPCAREAMRSFLGYDVLSRGS